MNTSNALALLREWISANVSDIEGVQIFNDEIPECEGFAVAIQPSPAPSKVFSFADDGEDGVPDRRVERVFNFLVRSSNAKDARDLAERIVTSLDGQTLESGNTQVDCFNPVLAQFIASDAKNNSLYTSAITCQYDVTEKE